MKSESLVLTSEYFKLILDKIIETFMHKHNITNPPKTFQLFGYGSFNDDKPSLKKDFEEIGHEFINGKYLYDKSRELEKGKRTIKINEYYKSIILLYLGYENFEDFLNNINTSKEDKVKQRALINKNVENTYYYLNYYFGEDNSVIKGKTVISNNWKKIKHTFLYPLDDGSFREHYSDGSVNIHGDTITIRTKTLSGEK